MTDIKDEICNNYDDHGALESLMDAMTREDELIVENKKLRDLLRQWRLAADIAKDLTFVPVAIATDKVLSTEPIQKKKETYAEQMQRMRAWMRKAEDAEWLFNKDRESK